MVAGIIQQDFITTPDLEALQGSLLDVATVTESATVWPSLDGMYESYNCMDLLVPTELCPDPVVDKTFESLSWPDGFRFFVQGGVTCKGPGFDLDGSSGELERVFNLRESVGVERALMETRMVASAGNWAAATNLTPAGGAVAPKVGLAILEGHAAANYAGVPTIHLPRTIGSLLIDGGTIGWDGSTLRSGQKSKVVSGGGYEYPNNGPAGTAPTAGELWIFATGEVQVAKHNVKTPEPQLDRTTNDVFALVERGFTVVVDCYTAAIRVKVQ